MQQISEEVFEIENRHGHPIHCVLNYADAPDAGPLVVVPPSWEGTVRRSLTQMLYLVRAGFRVLRFDFTMHRGNSYGPVTDFTLSSALDDIQAVMSFVRGPGGIPHEAGLGVYGVSMSSRVMVRYLAENPDAADVFVSLIGVVDVPFTIRAASGIEVARLYENPDHHYGISKGLHYKVDFDRFIRDVVAGDWDTLERTKADVDRMVTPTYMIVAEADQWIDVSQYPVVYRDNPGILRGTYKLPNAGHELYKNPEAAKVATLEATRIFHRVLIGGEVEIAEPSITELIDWNTRERTREREYGEPREPVIRWPRRAPALAGA